MAEAGASSPFLDDPHFRCEFNPNLNGLKIIIKWMVVKSDIIQKNL